MDLSSLRASRVVEYMIKEYDFPPTLLHSGGWGEYRPLADNKTLEGRQKNRRVDIVILNDAQAANEPSY